MISTVEDVKQNSTLLKFVLVTEYRWGKQCGIKGITKLESQNNETKTLLKEKFDHTNIIDVNTRDILVQMGFRVLIILTDNKFYRGDNRPIL